MERVDRKLPIPGLRDIKLKSRSAWSAWIERPINSFQCSQTSVALRMERVDRKNLVLFVKFLSLVALRMERVDRKFLRVSYSALLDSRAPHGARGSKDFVFTIYYINSSRAPHGARGSKAYFWRTAYAPTDSQSRSAWSAWIERYRRCVAKASLRVALRMERVDRKTEHGLVIGLICAVALRMERVDRKFCVVCFPSFYLPSRSAWSAWIERSFLGDIYNITEVALRMERVDRKRVQRKDRKFWGLSRSAWSAWIERSLSTDRYVLCKVALRMERVDRKFFNISL